jgi:CCR4-NOT transcription complex subunit 3
LLLRRFLFFLPLSLASLSSAAEIDRVLKKVDEGVELFDEIWDKVYSADSQNQKEKHEIDLKKEIKKLQRLRDQIKTWIGGTEVKDKDALVEARKLIETKMEQFKVCEKETKTKTYSKEGLARAEKLDPAEEAKNATVGWVQEYVERMQGLVEEADFEIEKLSSGKGKKSQKKVIEGLQQHIHNHRYHISRLEGIVRLVNNDRLDCDTVDGLRDDFDYYLDSYQDEEYMGAYDPDVFYESLGLEELDVVNVDHVTGAVLGAGMAGGPAGASGAAAAAAAAPGAAGTAKPGKGGGGGGAAGQDNDAASSSSRGSKDRKAGGGATKKGSLTSIIPINIGRARSAGAGKDAAKDDPAKPITPSKVLRSNSVTGPAAAPASSGSPAAAASASASPKSPAGLLAPPVVADVPPPVVPTPSSTAAAAGPATSMAAILKREAEQQQERERQKVRERRRRRRR